jgi:hypothetical protein
MTFLLRLQCSSQTKKTHKTTYKICRDDDDHQRSPQLPPGHGGGGGEEQVEGVGCEPDGHPCP